MMGSRSRLAIALIVAAIFALTLAACGASGGSTTSDGSTAGESPAAEANKKAKQEFNSSKSKVPKFGQEASVGEREAASAVLAENLQARGAKDWARQCASLSKAQAKAFAERATYYHVGKTCAKGLEREGKSAPAAVFVDTMTDPIVALRVKGKKGYALYHGNDGKNYAMPMELEGDEWKVAEVVTTEIP
ncbi:MAG: hypothetical protein H0X42_08785 [Solirubrobacterales bacterium]|nr:hypothetical protein [Solirubrobacterales bacterium]